MGTEHVPSSVIIISPVVSLVSDVFYATTQSSRDSALRPPGARPPGRGQTGNIILHKPFWFLGAGPVRPSFTYIIVPKTPKLESWGIGPKNRAGDTSAK